MNKINYQIVFCICSFFFFKGISNGESKEILLNGTIFLWLWPEIFKFFKLSVFECDQIISTVTGWIWLKLSYIIVLYTHTHF